MNLLGWECYSCKAQYRNKRLSDGSDGICPDKCAKCGGDMFQRVYDTRQEAMYDGRAPEEKELDLEQEEWEYMAGADYGIPND